MEKDKLSSVCYPVQLYGGYVKYRSKRNDDMEEAMLPHKEILILDWTVMGGKIALEVWDIKAEGYRLYYVDRFVKDGRGEELRQEWLTAMRLHYDHKEAIEENILRGQS